MNPPLAFVAVARQHLALVMIEAQRGASMLGLAQSTKPLKPADVLSTEPDMLRAHGRMAIRE
jgi:hypothetical protein